MKKINKKQCSECGYELVKKEGENYGGNDDGYWPDPDYYLCYECDRIQILLHKNLEIRPTEIDSFGRSSRFLIECTKCDWYHIQKFYKGKEIKKLDKLDINNKKDRGTIMSVIWNDWPNGCSKCHNLKIER